MPTVIKVRDLPVGGTFRMRHDRNRWHAGKNGADMRQTLTVVTHHGDAVEVSDERGYRCLVYSGLTLERRY